MFMVRIAGEPANYHLELHVSNSIRIDTVSKDTDRQYDIMIIKIKVKFLFPYFLFFFLSPL